MPDAVKLSSPDTGEFWEIPVLFEDEHLLALDKPAHLAVTPDSASPEHPSLVQLLHRSIERHVPWAKQRGLGYLMNPHRIDAEASGVIVFAKNKAAFTALADQFASDQPRRVYAALARGEAPSDTFDCDAKLAPHPLQMGVMRVDAREGKRSRTLFTVRERFDGGLLLECKPMPDRPAQIQVHLKQMRLPVVGAQMYGGRPLFLSALKPDYQPKPDQEERPLMGRAALHLEEVIIDHPIAGEKLTIKAPWPKDFNASVKYLRRFARS